MIEILPGIIKDSLLHNRAQLSRIAWNSVYIKSSSAATAVDFDHNWAYLVIENK